MKGTLLRFTSEEICEMILIKWDHIEEIVRILKIPYQATIVMQKEDYTLSDFYTCWLLMNRKLTKICAMQNKTTLAQNLLNRLSEREGQFLQNPAMTCAIALDPRFCKTLSAVQKATATENLSNLWKRIHNEIEEEGNDSIDLNLSDADITVANTTLLTQFFEKPSNPSSINISALINKFAETKHHMENMTILAFWEANKNAFPELHKLSEIIYSISPTQAVVERAFSTLSYVFNARRSRLSEKTLESLLLISLNKELFNSVNDIDREALI